MIQKLGLLLLGMLFGITTLKGINATEKKAVSNPDWEYHLAMTEYVKRNYKKSLTQFEEIERKYPTYHKQKEVLIMQAFLQYLNKEYQMVDIVVRQFFDLYPNQPEKIYMEYLAIMSRYRQITGLAKSYDILKETYLNLLNFADQHPETSYGKEAKEKINHLAAILYHHEISVGEFYQSRGDIFAAINRYNQIIKLKPPGLIAIALYRLHECYQAIGANDLSEKYRLMFEEERKQPYKNLPFVVKSKIYNIAPLTAQQCNSNITPLEKPNART